MNLTTMDEFYVLLYFGRVGLRCLTPCKNRLISRLSCRLLVRIRERADLWELMVPYFAVDCSTISCGIHRTSAGVASKKCVLLCKQNFLQSLKVHWYCLSVYSPIDFNIVLMTASGFPCVARRL